VDDEIKPITTIIASPIWSSEKDSYDTDLYWIGKGNGLSYWKTGMDTVATYDKVNGYDESKTTAIYDLYTLDNGNILMATSLGIYEFSSKEGIIQRYWEGGSSTYHLPLNEYYYIYQDEAGIFWLGSGGGGLVRWNKETGEYKQYTTENGFSSNMICAIYEDEEKNLWMSSYNGLIRFNKETEKIRIYKTENGLTHNEFNRGAHFKTADGKLYFGGTNGINSFYPKVLLAEEKNETVPLEVTSIYHFNSNADKLIDKLALFKREKKITLRPNEGFINIEFSLLDYRRKGNTTYAYKIEGQSDQWQYIKDNQLRVSGLSYGEYTVRVKGQMSNGSFSEKELVMNLCVLRPFYLKWWFILSTFLAFVFGLYQFIQWRGKWLIERGEELEKQVNKQTQQLQKQAIELKEVDKLKSRFFANVSHELRTPITLIQGPVRSVLNNENLDKDDKFLLTKVEENTEHLLSMVNELMDLTKAEAYKLEINESNVIFYDVLKRRLSSFQSLADMKSIQLDLEFHLDKDLGIALDVDKFGKIINNLLSNAFKFTPNEGEIKVTVEEESKNLLLKVADTGRGIPKADIPFIFNRFYQSSINKKAEGGLGIGLSLSMEFVKLLGGKMWIESKEGQGSTFFVSLPKKEIENISVDELNVFDKEQEHPKLEPRKLNSPPPIAVSNTDSEFLSQQIILVVEDNLDLQEYLHYLLAPHYYEIHVVNNGKEALEWITANRFPSLILSDLMMPIMDGFELLEQVKADKKLSSIPFIMLTARAELRDKLKALRIGVDDYLTKPFKEEELKVRINNLLSNFEERREYLMSEQPGHAGLKDEEQHLPETSDDDRMWLKNLEKIIIEEIGHHYFSIDYLAEKIGVKRDKLFKRTKALTGLTPNKYVRAVRLQLAKELLENKEYATVKDVAHKVGFQKIEYFSTLYKKQFGKSPSEYIR
ncbi:MAG: signal transduction histidine kinase/DNA-binding response OmpR family regulator, partial [Maribacter sp.]